MARHIVHVADYGNPAPGSFVPALVALADELHRRGDRCSLIAGDVPGAVWHDRARAAFDEFAIAANARQLLKTLWRMKPDFVHVHFVGWSLPATLAAYAMGSRVIWHLHSAMRERPGWIQSARTFLKYRALGAGVRTFVVVSELLREGLVDLGIDADRIAVIRNAVDAQHFHPPTAHERSQARQALGLGDGDRALLFFGRDVEVKGADILWNALDDCEPVVLVGVGLPPKAVREFEARGRTIVVPFAADVAPLFWAADALVMPSRREGAPYTMLEALCTGLPVIAGNIPPIAEIARESACVELVNNEPAALSRALRAHAMRRSASTAQVRARLGLDRWVAEVAGLYAA